VVGTRAAAFAPVTDPGLLIIWDDGDDLHAEPRAPYPHARDVLVYRAHATGAALLVAGFARTAEAQLLVESGWANEVLAERARVREVTPRVAAVGETEVELARDPNARAARLPKIAFEAAREALDRDEPVLVQVPRAGYVPGLACGQCRELARCRRCAGPLGLPTGRGAEADGRSGPVSPSCRWCGRTEPAYRCPACGSRRLRATVVGARPGLPRGHGARLRRGHRGAWLGAGARRSDRGYSGRGTLGGRGGRWRGIRRRPAAGRLGDAVSA
jgi:primosomal protein N' (replication factor Y)